MERVQRAAARAISGVVRSTPADEACLEEMGPADFHLFTDGAADGGTERGGGGVVVFDGGGEVERLSLPAGIYCSSFTVEAAAMLAVSGGWGRERDGPLLP